MKRNSMMAIFEGLERMPNRPLLNTMMNAYSTFVEGIADNNTDPFVRLDEMMVSWAPSDDSAEPDAYPVFIMISEQRPMEDIAAKAREHEGDPDFDTRNVGYDLTWKDIRDWATRNSAMTEGVIGKFVKKAAPIALAAGLGAAGYALKDKVADAAHGAVSSVKERVHAEENYGSAYMTVSRWNASADLLNGWKYVDRSEKPGIYSDSLNHTNLDELEGEKSGVPPFDPIKIGWRVSPDGKTLMSTVTGRVYKPRKSFYDKDFTRSDLGTPVGTGVLYIDKSLEDIAFQWDVEALYGK